MSDQEENNVAEEEPVSMVEAEAEAEAEAEPEPEAEPAAEEETVVENGDGEMEANCRKAFDLFDLDGSGKISASEFGTVMRSLGQNPTDDDIEELLKSVDQDMDGSLSFEEFVQLMQKRVESQKDVNEGDLFRDAFKVFDKDGSGKISKSELKNILTSYGNMKLSDSDADELLAAVDADGDDLLDYEEFVKLFTDNSIILGPSSA